MVDILHRMIIDASPGAVYAAVTQQSKLSAWWTRTTSNEKVGDVACFFFGPKGEHQIKMEITCLTPNEKVTWKCIDGPWVETGEFEFHISKHERGSVLQFRHSGWAEPNEFYMHCNSKWGFFLVVSLKNLLETGSGQAHPNDPNI